MYSSVKLQACRPTATGVTITAHSVICHSEINRDVRSTTVVVAWLEESCVLVVLSSANSVTQETDTMLFSVYIYFSDFPFCSSNHRLLKSY